LTRSRDQLEQTARKFIREAYAAGMKADDDVIAYAADLMGKEHLALIGRAFARFFALNNLS